VKRIAVYPGTFDPVTNGHLDLVERGRRLFDRFILAILENRDKRPMFTIPERAAMLREATVGLDNVEVEAFDGLLVHYARRVGAAVIVRGIRAVTDFDYELQMAMMNRRLASSVETLFLVPSEEYSYVSSRLVREIAVLGGDLSGLVPPPVAAALRARAAELEARPR